MFRLNSKRPNSGFTLIELLVVISIIGVLSSVALVSMNSARSRARDAKRSAEIIEIIKALNLTYDKNSKVPCHSWDDSISPTFMKFLVDDGYTGSIPRDPLNNGSSVYQYITFKAIQGGPCGQYASVGVFFENSVPSCPGNGYMVPGYSNRHCHFFFPSELPAPCNTVAVRNDESLCSQLIDSVNDY